MRKKKITAQDDEVDLLPFPGEDREEGLETAMVCEEKCACAFCSFCTWVLLLYRKGLYCLCLLSAGLETLLACDLTWTWR